MKKYLLITLFLIILLAGFSIYQYFEFSDGKLHIIFCDVGQGDSILIRTAKGKTILVDGGPDDSVLKCLSDHRPFWQRDIDLMMLSHPHADHYTGLISVLNRYHVDIFATEELENNTAGFKYLQDLIHKKVIDTKYLLANDRFHIEEGLIIKVLGPDKTYLKTTSPNGSIGENKEFASLVLNVSYEEFDLVLAGDSQANGLYHAIENRWSSTLEVLHIPHHGSKTGLDAVLLASLRPGLAVISVGKNKYGHPSPDVIKILRDKAIKILRTDQKGDIEIMTDGKRWWAG